jgi:hypothetical protein
MSTEMLEQRVAELERRLEAVEAKTFTKKPKGAWRELIGWAKDDDLHRDAARLGAEWHQRMNEEGR